MSTVSLTPEQARVLGCLLEKSLTTPEQYPLSLNALISACNQTTNRDPVVHFDEAAVEDALAGLRELGLVTRGKAPGERAIKHRHRITEQIPLGADELALMGVLLLRGAQTPGELKGRSERWHGFGSLDEVEAALQRLAGRDLVVQLERRPGQHQARWTQLLCPSLAATDPGSGAAVGHTPSLAAAPPVAPPAGVGRPSLASAPELIIRNPATGEVLRTLAADSEAEVAAKVARACAAQPDWAAQVYSTRAAALRAFSALLEAELEHFAAVTTSETGKPLAQARNEVRAVRARIEWFVAKAEAVIAGYEVSDDGQMTERVSYEPVGVVAHVSAWNYPYFVGLNSVVPALLTGNAVLYKPSELATLTGLAIVDGLHRSGVPSGVLQCVIGDGATGAALVADDDVGLVCFTGSYGTGRAIAMAVAPRLGRLQLELGGKDAVYVADDVDVEAAASALAEGVFYNAGQSCCAVERLYVQRSVHDRFVEAFVAAVRRDWQAGDPADPSTTLGPLARPAQRVLLEEQVADATARGAHVAYQGEAPSDAWFPPTVLVGVDHSMRVMREESFGPVIGIMPVDDDDAAVALVDDSPYGLTGGIFSGDAERAQRFLERLDTGTVYWNCSDRTSVQLPWAGRRNSGLGVSMSEAGIRSFVREKAWHLRRA